jgi:hypothetical protein
MSEEVFRQLIGDIEAIKRTHKTVKDRCGEVVGKIASHVKSPEVQVGNIDIIYPDAYGIRLELLEYDRPQLIAVASVAVIGQPSNFLYKYKAWSYCDETHV